MASSRPPRDALQLLGYISAAVHDPELQGSVAKVTQFVYEAYSQRYAALGEQPPTIAFGSLNQEIGIAFAQLRAQREYAAAQAEFRNTGNDQALTNRMLAPSFRAELGQQPTATSRLQFRYSYVAGGPGLETEVFRTYVPDLPGPASVAELEDLLEQDAIAQAEDYGEFFMQRTDFVSPEFF